MTFNNNDLIKINKNNIYPKTRLIVSLNKLFMCFYSKKQDIL